MSDNRSEKPGFLSHDEIIKMNNAIDGFVQKPETFLDDASFQKSQKLLNRKKSLSQDEIIKLKETVGQFVIGERHYCHECDSVCLQLEEDTFSEVTGMFGIFSFLLPWKWALVATIFFFKGDKTQSVCTRCYPSFYDDWLVYRSFRKKRIFRNISLFLMAIVILFLSVLVVFG